MKTIKATGYDLPLVHHPEIASVPIHPHQAAMVDEWNTRDSFLLVTKTGSGKTAATALPVALNRDKSGDNCAVFVYPTKALIEDQERSIIEFYEQRLGLRVNRITPDDHQHRAADIDLVRLDADILGEFAKGGNKADALERLLNVSGARIVLINPDILYLLYSLKYGRRGANSIAALQAYQTIVFDEFHLYNGVELANILYLIYAARVFGAFRRVVLLSATPHPDVHAWMNKLLQNPREVTMSEVVQHPLAPQPRRVAHDVKLTPLFKAEMLSALPQRRHKNYCRDCKSFVKHQRTKVESAMCRS
jgi:CRISPR-associated helicase Cas3